MATKKCVNGHLYDPAIYGDKCPFCPSPSTSTKVLGADDISSKTIPMGGETDGPTKPTEPIVGGFPGGGDAPEGGTVIRHINGIDGATGQESGGRRLVGLLVSYSAVPTGEVYKVYEGRTTIGRDVTCDLPFPNDNHMSSKHLLIQYVEAKGAFRAQEYDKGSANGSYVNGKVYVLGDVIDLKDKDVIVLGGTKFIFLAVPEF